MKHVNVAIHRFFSFRPAGGAGRRLLGPGRSSDDIALQELHPAHDCAERLHPLPGGAAVRSDHEASDKRTERPVEDELAPGTLPPRLPSSSSSSSQKPGP